MSSTKRLLERSGESPSFRRARPTTYRVAQLSTVQPILQRSRRWLNHATPATVTARSLTNSGDSARTVLNRTGLSSVGRASKNRKALPIKRVVSGDDPDHRTAHHRASHTTPTQPHHRCSSRSHCANRRRHRDRHHIRWQQSCRRIGRHMRRRPRRAVSQRRPPRRRPPRC